MYNSAAFHHHAQPFVMMCEQLFARVKTAAEWIGAGIRHSRLCIQDAITYSGSAYFLMFSGDRCCTGCEDCMKPHQFCLAAVGEASPGTVKYLNTAVRSH